MSVPGRLWRRSLFAMMIEIMTRMVLLCLWGQWDYNGRHCFMTKETLPDSLLLSFQNKENAPIPFSIFSFQITFSLIWLQKRGKYSIRISIITILLKSNDLLDNLIEKMWWACHIYLAKYFVLNLAQDSLFLVQFKRQSLRAVNLRGNVSNRGLCVKFNAKTFPDSIEASGGSCKCIWDNFR